MQADWNHLLQEHMAVEEEVLVELEALEAVYGGDCTILEKYPPVFHFCIKPQTADVTSQQFVEATISIQAGPKYPDEPPNISMVDSKGLDEQRQKNLTSWISEKANELSSCLMLVSLCEEAVERLSSTNHPDGDCPLCLYPLVDEVSEKSSFPFMKLMSCFHCFHCDCIIRWWNWLQLSKETDATNILGSSASSSKTDVQQEDSKGNCPVCRKVFTAKDIEHVRDMVEMQSHSISERVESNNDVDEGLIFLHSDFEKIRREKFDAIIRAQEQKGGLIEEGKTHEVVLRPGLYLLQGSSAAVDAKEEPDNQRTGSSHQSSSSNRPATVSTNRYYSTRRKPKAQNPRTQARQWVKKENS